MGKCHTQCRELSSLCLKSDSDNFSMARAITRLAKELGDDPGQGRAGCQIGAEIGLSEAKGTIKLLLNCALGIVAFLKLFVGYQDDTTNLEYFQLNLCNRVWGKFYAADLSNIL